MLRSRESRRGSSTAGAVRPTLAARIVRDSSRNPMAVVKSVQVLNEMEAEETHRRPGSVPSPGLCIVIQNSAAPRPVAPVTIEHEPQTEPDDAA